VAGDINIGILGASGRVGQELLSVLEQRDFPLGKLKLLASSRSQDRKVDFKGSQYGVEVASADSFCDLDLVLASAGAEVSRQFASAIVASGATLIDNSSAFRMNPAVPLVVPEVNAHALHSHQGIIANPNCSTSQLVIPLKLLHDAAGLKRVIVATYQSVSGAGAEAMEELEAQTHAILHGSDYEMRVFQRQIAFNLIPHIDAFDDSLYSREEIKLIEETRKILELPDLPVTATAVRVPVVIGHSEAVTVDLEKRLSPHQVREILCDSPSIEVWDDPDKGIYPTPVDVAGQDPVYVGRIRHDTSSPTGINMWIVADNLRIGAALNAVQIAEYLLKHELLRQRVGT